ncbi:MAG: 2-amino-4-hydroxy-6-hydroxymethyldihydropteridine diphosphokinase [Myxococcota bacterium]|nr:2-amino-4-hydroxy-6-hydroxymethyldihydropteridine diphosphokinase [Myxococcota bacterium]
MIAPGIEPLVLGLGGNVGGELAITGRFQRARDALAALGELRTAALYRSAPIGPAQPPYLNTALRLRVTDLQPAELLAVVRELESLLGRDRSTEVRWGPRTFDLDVLVWGARIVATSELEVPHPRLHERRFALAPLVDLLGADFEIPRVGPAGAVLARTRDQPLEYIAETW